VYLSISHWGLFGLHMDEYESYWNFVWWGNADARGAYLP
jgi:hypothetical protein